VCGLEETQLSPTESWIQSHQNKVSSWMCTRCIKPYKNGIHSEKRHTRLYTVGSLWHQKCHDKLWRSPIKGYVFTKTAYTEHMSLYPDIYEREQKRICKHYRYDPHSILTKDQVYGGVFLVNPTVMFCDEKARLIVMVTFTWDGYVENVKCLLFAPEREMTIQVSVNTFYTEGIIHHTYSWTDSVPRRITPDPNIQPRGCSAHNTCARSICCIEVTDTQWIQFKLEYDIPSASDVDLSSSRMIEHVP